MKSRYWTMAVICIILISAVTTGVFSEGAEADEIDVTTDESDYNPFGETGRVTLENTIDNGHYKTVEFENEYEDPVVVAFIMTRNGGQSVDARVRNVEGSSCEIFMEEPDDGGHLSEDVGYMVMEKGVHAIEDDFGEGILVEAGTVVTSEVKRNGESCEGEDVDFSSVFTNAAYSSSVRQKPALLHTLNTHNNGEFMTTSVSEFTTESFNIQQEAAGSGSSSDFEKIGWIAIAIEKTTDLTSIDDVPFKARYTTTPEDFGVDDSPIYHTLPNIDTDTAIVISKGVSTNDDDGYWTRASGDFSSEEFGVYAEEDQVEDDDRGHGSEYLGHIVIGEPIVFKEVDSDGDVLADQLELRMTQTKEYEFAFEDGSDYDDPYELEVDSTSGGTTDPAGNHEYGEGELVTINAEPDNGYELDHWSGDVSGDSLNITVEMDEDIYIKAHFEAEIYELEVDSTSGGTTDPAGTHEYAEGEEVDVTAIPNNDYVFDHWSGDVSGTSPTITVEMDEDKYIKAHFGEGKELEISATSGGYVNPYTGTRLYAEGEEVEVTAIPNNDHVFDYWSGDVSGDSSTITVEMDEDKYIQAH
ncbi:MAG: InlB B-repeat-containing protein, partial [Candidatus Saliniplasma sp.]